MIATAFFVVACLLLVVCVVAAVMLILGHRSEILAWCVIVLPCGVLLAFVVAYVAQKTGAP